MTQATSQDPAVAAGVGAEPGPVTRRGPIRTCVGCRAAVPQAELVRIAMVQGRAVADPGRRLPGRGAYVHARPTCLAAAGKGGLARSLRRGVSRAELEALGSILAQDSTGAGARGAGSGAPPGAAPGDPDAISPGHEGAEAVESGSPSSTRAMSNPRPSSAATATRSTSSTGGADRSS